jgi:hypothetical protein
LDVRFGWGPRANAQSEQVIPGATQMTINEILLDLENKVFPRADTIQESTKVEQVIFEKYCTKLLTRLLTAKNKRCLTNFSLRLEMDDVVTLGGH